MIHIQQLLVLLPLACIVAVTGPASAQAQGDPASDVAVPTAWKSGPTTTPVPRGGAWETRTTQPVLAERPRYLSDVAAKARLPGGGAPWPEPSPLAAALPQDTVAPWPWGWMARGFVGGLVAGPIGTAVAYRMIPRGEAGAALDERIRARRKEAVVVGGILGTGVLVFVLLRVIDLDGRLQGGNGGQGPEPA